jgi:anaerobic selenocysteine-containing dehydrogenase
MEALKSKGVKVICIDPVRTDTCRYFDAEWLAPRPQTDVAMMLGIAHTLYTEKLHDAKFLARYTTGFDRFVPYLTGSPMVWPRMRSGRRASARYLRTRSAISRADSLRSARCWRQGGPFSVSIMASSHTGCW